MSLSRSLIAAVALASAATASHARSQAPTQPPAAVEWVKRNGFEFADVDRWDGFADLQPLKRMIENARIVALGEGTHGTHEFFALKRRLTEFLATDMGFTIFAMEANMPEAKLIGDYVRTGKGDPVALMRGLRFWTANTAELPPAVRCSSPRSTCSCPPRRDKVCRSTSTEPIPRWPRSSTRFTRP
jgi:erythromycin esterase